MTQYLGYARTSSTGGAGNYGNGKTGASSILLLAIPVLCMLVLLNAAKIAAYSVDSKVLVHIPFSLHNASGFSHGKAEFGFATVSPSKSLSAYVYYIEQTLCLPVTNQSVGYPIHESTPWETPFILMINGGGLCSAVTKVRHGQNIGASAVLLATPHCQCSDTDCMTRFPGAGCNTRFPLLVNDGSGDDITIPSFVLDRPISEDLKAELRDKNQPVLVELQWGIPDANLTQNPPQFHFWTTAYDPLVSLETYVDMRTVVTSLGSSLVFSPRYALFNGTRFGCPSNTADDVNGPCDHLCTNHGRYCTVHATDLSGHAIVNETLRRLCVWKHAATPDQYWDYVIEHKRECGMNPHAFADPMCIGSAFQAAKVEEGPIVACMAEGSIDSDAPNSLLDDSLQNRSLSGVVSLPAVTLNHQILPYPSARSLFDTVCAAYWYSSVPNIPKVCETCLSCPDAIGCLREGKCVGSFANKERFPDNGMLPHNKHPYQYHDPEDHHQRGGRGRRVRRIFGWLFGLAAIGGIAYYSYNQYLQQRDGGFFRPRNGRGLMTDYLHLSSEE